jgi:protein-tyrosine phosphatase
MATPLKSIAKAMRIITSRVREQGLRTTLIWAYGRGLPKLTGVPMLRYSAITPDIYVGPQYGKRGLRHLTQHGIGSGVNMRVEFDDAEHGLALVNYCHLPTVDDDAPTLEHLQQGATFIHERVLAGDRVYIHCAGGVGRAPTMAAAYFISRGMSLQDTLDLIKRGRPFVKMTKKQLDALMAFEANFRAEYKQQDETVGDA